MRIHVFLRDAGIASRRKAEEMIVAGRVTVDGKTAILGQDVTGKEDIRVNGKRVVAQNIAPIYYLVNKPEGYTSTTARYPNEQNVVELLPKNEQSRQWQIAGRLDKNSKGLLLVTNDGHTVLVLTHPRYEVKKVYEVALDADITPKEMAQLTRGVGDYVFYSVRKLSGKSLYEIVLQEGKKREIREAFKIIHRSVMSLQRLQMGPLTLAGLSEGHVRLLTVKEITELSEFIKKAEKRGRS